MPYIRFAAPASSTDPFFHKRACGPSSCRPAAAPSPSFNPLADLLSAFESEFSTKSSQQEQPNRLNVVPHFDVQETDDAYILEGELPGVSDKKTIDIQFSDAQTLVVKGEIRRKSVGQQDQQQQRDVEELVQNEVEDVVAEQEEKAVESSSSSTRSFRPTVEETIDESESGSENDFEVVNSPSKGKAVDKTSEQPQAQVADKPLVPEVQKPVEVKKAAVPAKSNNKYWISERAVGEFARSFSFQSLIDQDNVKARLEHGILEIVVPKRQPYVRRVQIQ